MGRILFILDELFPVRGAPQVRIGNLFEGAVGWERSAIGGRTGPGDAPSGYRLIDRPSERRPFAFLLFLARLGLNAGSEARRLRPEVVVVSVPKYELLIFAPLLKRFTSRLVVDLRDSLEFLDYGAYLSHFLPRPAAVAIGRLIGACNRIVQRRALRAADVVTTANEGIRRSIDHPNAVVVPNGVDTGSFTPMKKEWYDRSRPLRLVYLGNFAEKDRFDWLRGLVGRSDIELHLIGDGRNRSKVLEALAGVNLVVHGVVQHDDLPTVLSKMDIGFIFREKGVDQSIPVCLFEYTAMNIPAVCNDTGIMAQFVRDRGIGFVVNDVPDFMGIVERIAADPRELTSFGGLHEIAERNFSLRASREIFRQLLGQGQGQGQRAVENGA